jgi:monoamine oxidase
MAGLAAAYDLVQAGYDVTVLEGSDHPGGRVCTLRDADGFTDGVTAEAGAMFLPQGHTNTIHYAKLLNLTLQPVTAPGVAMYYLRGQRIPQQPNATINWPVYLTALEQAAGLPAMVKAYAAPNLKELGNPLEPHWPPKYLEHLDHLTYSEYLQSRGASPCAAAIIGMRYHCLYGDGIDACSALFQLRDADLETTHNGGGSFYVQGGNDLYPKAFAAKLGGRVTYNAPVCAISQSAAGVTAFFDQGGERRRLAADHLVCAIPFAVLRERVTVDPPFSAAKQEVIRELPNTSVARVFLQMKEAFWTAQGLNGAAFTDLPIMSIYPSYEAQSGGKGVLSCYAAGRQARYITAMSPAQRIEFALDHVAKVFPEAPKYFEAAAVKCWDEDVFARGGYIWCRPGQVGRFVPLAPLPEGRVHFAGDHTSAFPGWIEGAIQSGLRCSHEIQSALN